MKSNCISDKPNSLNDRGRVLGIGLACLDFIWKSDGAGPYIMNGGTCANVMCALQLMGWNARVAIRSAYDSWNMRLLAGLAYEGVDIIEYGKQNHTPRIIVEDRVGKAPKYITRCPYCGKRLLQNVNMSLQEAMYLEPEIYSAEIVFFDRMPIGAAWLCKKAKANGSMTVFEPNFMYNKNTLLNNSMFTDVFKCSCSQIPRSFTDILRQQCEKKIGPSLIVRTMGRTGLEFCVRNSSGMSEWVFVGPLVTQSQILDSSGAGDWLTAAIIDELFCQNRRKIDIELVLRAFEHAAPYVEACCMSNGSIPGGLLTSIGGATISWESENIRYDLTEVCERCNSSKR